MDLLSGYPRQIPILPTLVQEMHLSSMPGAPAPSSHPPLSSLAYFDRDAIAWSAAPDRVQCLYLGENSLAA